MQNHTKVYIEYFGFSVGEFIPCECCGATAVDIHHIHARGMGGNKSGNKDVIENLMALCRECHNQYGDITELEPVLIKIHTLHMQHKKQVNPYHNGR